MIIKMLDISTVKVHNLVKIGTFNKIIRLIYGYIQVFRKEMKKT